MSNDEWSTPNFGSIPAEYRQQFFEEVRRQLDLVFDQMRYPGAVDAGTMRLQSLPTTPAGLATGEVWNDNGILKIVSETISVFPEGLEGDAQVGTVTVSTP